MGKNVKRDNSKNKREDRGERSDEEFNRKTHENREGTTKAVLFENG